MATSAADLRGASAIGEAVDPRNRLNDLSNREWLKRTKSVWYSQPGPRDALKAQHPATFAESDVARLIELFTKRGERVLDPFLGSGSTLIACLMTRRLGLGIELVPRWATVARRRVRGYLARSGGSAQEPTIDPNRDIICGDSRHVLAAMPPDCFDFAITSPPYWNILHKERGMKQARERRNLNLPTRYSDLADDLGNLSSYEAFLDELHCVWVEVARVLRPGRYLAVIVSDFRHGDRYYLYHADTARIIERTGLVLKGTIVLVQDNKNLYPYGIPYTFVPNVHHQVVIVLQKPC